MIIDLAPEPGDDPTFLLAVSAIAAAMARDERPTELRLIRIARWFDHKWLGYSGKGRVYFEPWVAIRRSVRPPRSCEFWR